MLMTALAISGSPSRQSKSRRRLADAVERLVVSAGVDVTDAEFSPTGPADAALARVDRALTEAQEVFRHVVR